MRNARDEVPTRGDSGLSIALATGRAAPSETLRDLVRLLAPCEDIYPGIDLWLARRALPGILDGARAALLAYDGDLPVGASVVKFDGELKLCSLRVVPSHEERGIGTALFAAAASILAAHGPRFHFTAPEGLSTEKHLFFERLGFRPVGRFGAMYRPGESEWLFLGETHEVAQRAHFFSRAALDICMGLNTILMSVRPRFASAILDGSKSVELRARFSARHVGAVVVLYASAPAQSIVGTARIASVREMTLDEIRSGLMAAIGCTEEELSAYANGRDRLTAIELDEIRPLDAPLERRELEREIGAPLRPPMSYQTLNGGSRWDALRSKLGV